MYVSAFGADFLYIISLLFDILKIDTCKYLLAIGAMPLWAGGAATRQILIL